jgi:hypothetical protein
MLRTDGKRNGDERDARDTMARGVPSGKAIGVGRWESAGSSEVGECLE